MSKYTIRQCTRSDYPQVLDVMNDAFGVEHGFTAKDEAMQNNMSHIAPYEHIATDEEIAKYYAAFDGNKVIGTAAIFPFEWVVSDGDRQYRLEVFGVGQVTCMAEYQKQGIMTSLLSCTDEIMRKTDAHLKFLIGDRFRYRRFGYEIGGNVVDLLYTKRSFVDIPAVDIEMRKATDGDTPLLNSMYTKNSSYLVRSEHKWMRDIEYKLGTILIGEKDGKNGYIAVSPRWGAQRAETGGDPEIVLELIRRFLENAEIGELYVQMPFSHTPTKLAKALHKSAFKMSLLPYGHFAFFDFDRTFELLADSVENQTGRTASSFDAVQREAIVRRLFGFAYHPLPECIAGLQSLRPLCTWVPDNDNM